MATRDSEFPQRVARLKSALGELVEETESISQRAKRRTTGKITRVSQPILPALDVPLDIGEEDTVDARAPTEAPPPPPAPSAPPEPEASRYSIVSPSNRPKKK